MTDPRLARHLAAAEPGWTHRTDVVVAGSGIAGLSAALHARAAGHAVTVVTKVSVADGSTRWAQGGIAAALDPTDSPGAHLQDTLVAGVGLCDPRAVEVLVCHAAGTSALTRMSPRLPATSSKRAPPRTSASDASVNAW